MATTNPKSQGESWFNRLIDHVKPQPPAPKSPVPPPVDQTAWEQSVNAHKVNTLTVHDVGLIVFDETQSFTDSDKANDTIGGARQKVAHALINADSQFGGGRPSTAHPIEPTKDELKNVRVRQAYISSVDAARNAYLSPTDPTNGATNFQFLTNADRSNMKFKGGSPKGLPIKTQSGPFDNSFLKGDVPSRQAYVNTYGQ